MTFTQANPYDNANDSGHAKHENQATEPNAIDEHPEFTKVLLESCRRCVSEIAYLPESFMALLSEYFGVAAAKYLLSQPAPPDGFRMLFDKGRLDLTMEAIILESNEWIALFTDSEVRVAFKRLNSHGYKPRAKADKKS